MAKKVRLNAQNFYVYALFRETGVIFYIGKGSGRRWLHHELPCNMNGQDRKTRVIKKILRTLTEVPKIKISEGMTETAAHSMECLLIKTIGRYPNGPLLNLTDGGEGVSDSTGAIGKKISAAKIGHPTSDATRELLRIHNQGKTHTEETKAKMTMAHTGHVRTPEHNEKLAASKRGKPRSIETKAKISVSKKGKPLTPEHVTAIGDGHRGLKRNAETKAKMSEARRRWWATQRANQPPEEPGLKAAA